MRDLLRDVVEVVRGLRRTPRFTLLCALVLGVGIGLSSAMFGAVEAVLLRRLPVSDQDGIVVTWGTNLPRNFAHVPFREREWRELAERTRMLGQVAAVDYNGSWPWIMKEGKDAYPVRRGLVSGGFFRTLGVTPVLGRVLVTDDDRVGVEPVAVISHAFWQRQFGGDSSVVGRRLTMHATGVTYTIVGVTPPGLDYPARTELWAPIIPATTYGSADTSAAIVDIVGRMRPGVTPDAVRNEVTEFFRQPERSTAVRHTTGVARTLPAIVVGDVRRELTLLALAVGLLLLAACLNVAGLLLMRGTHRGRDVAVRMAVGASRARIVRWHVTEGVLLAALGCALGVAVAWAALGTLRAYAPGELPRLDEIRPDLVVMIAAASLALLTGILFSTGPALAASRTDAAVLLRGGGRAASGGRRSRRAREGLVMAQVAAAVVVLSGAALVVRSLEKLRGADLGFTKDNVMIVDLAWDYTRVTSYDRALAIQERLLPRLRAIPGLVSASPILLTPFSGTSGWDIVFVATDRGLEEQKNNPWLNTEVVSPDYFDVFRIPLEQGRSFTDADRAGAPRVVVLSEEAARTLWPDGQALGRRLRLLSGDDSLTWMVAGIVGETRYRDYRRPRATIYFPHRQPPFPLSVPMLAISRQSESAVAPPRHSHGARRNGAGAHGRPGIDDGCTSRNAAGAAALQCIVAGNVRGVGAVDRRRGSLRRHRVFRAPAREGVRDPRRSRCASSRAACARLAVGGNTRRRGIASRSRRGDVRQSDARIDAVRGESARPDRPRSRRPPARRRVRARDPRPHSLGEPHLGE
jgi:predicted permease